MSAYPSSSSRLCDCWNVSRHGASRRTRRPCPHEAVRFRTRQTFRFHQVEIYELARDNSEGNEKPPEMTVAFMGPRPGVLPHHYTELLMSAPRYQDTRFGPFWISSTTAYLAVLSHVEKYRFPSLTSGASWNQFTGYLFDIIGCTGRPARPLSFDLRHSSLRV